MGRASKPGSFLFYAGIGILALALFTSVFFGALAGVLPVLVGLALSVLGLTKAGRKAAGAPCAACARIIALEYDAEFCDDCRQPIHAACASSHRSTAHKQEQGHPFR